MKAEFRAMAVGLVGIILIFTAGIARLVEVAGQVVSFLAITTMDEITRKS